MEKGGQNTWRRKRAGEMGRNSNKCRRVLPEVAVAEAELPALIGDGGVRTRPRMKEAEASLETPEKRSREVADGQLDFASNSAFAELRSSTRRRVMIEEATKSLSPADGLASCGPLTAVEVTSPSSEPASCCSSDASIQLVAERSTIADPTGQAVSAQLETLTFSGGRYNRSEAIPSSSSCAEESGDMESAVAARPLGEANSRLKPAVNEMPSKVEIEDFLSSAEKDIHKRFSEKYNFDAEKGVPMKGRYEWVPVKP